ncbi:MAG: ABC transporter permease subunit [Saprospiraceae bacterium]
MKKGFLKYHYWAYAIVLIYVLVAICAPILSNQRALICKSSQGWFFPAFSDNVIDTTQYVVSNTCIYPMIRFSPNQIDHDISVASSPLTKNGKHLLGTDKLGRDVAAGMVYGARTSLQIGFIAIFFSFMIGVPLGIVSAYYRDQGSQFNLLQFGWMFLVGIMMIFYLAYFPDYGDFHFGAVVMIILASIIIMKVGNKIFSTFKGCKKYNFPLDLLLIKIIEVRKSLPVIFVLLALTALFTSPSIWNIILIIILLSWTDFARFARAETLAVKEESYILSAKVLGLNDLRISMRHIFPNILPTLVVIACFGVSSAILLESSLSFLGIGLPVEQVTWGRMIADGRDMSAWWLVVFPGVALCILVLSLNIISERWQGT